MSFSNVLKSFNHKRNTLLRLSLLRAKLVIYKASRKHRVLNPRAKKIVIYMGKGIGDCLILSGLIESLRSANHKITVITESKCAFLFNSIIKVDGVILKKNKMKLSGYDIFIDPYDGAHNVAAKIRLILNSKFDYTIGFNTNAYDININYSEYQSHFTSRFKHIQEILKNDNESTAINLTPNEEIEQQVTKWVNSTLGEKKLIVLCPFASNEVRSLSPTQCAEILRRINNKTHQALILGTKEQLSALPDELRNNFITDSIGSFDSAIALIKLSECVISVDTVFVHISKLYNKKLLAIYNNRIIDNVFENNYVFSPNYANATVLFTEENLHTSEGDIVANLPISKLTNSVDEFI